MNNKMPKEKLQPKNWRRVKLGDIMKTPRPDVEEVKTSEYKKVGRIPIFDQGSKEIAGYTNNGRTEYHGKLPAILFGDHTLTLNLVEKPFALGADGVQVIEPDELLFDRRFFYYALKSLKIRSYGYERHLKYLRELQIYCPDIKSQKRIADILSAFDDKIELNNKISRTLEEMAAAIFKEWFVNFKFSGHEKEKMVDSELGKIPKGWEVKKIEEIVQIEYGKGPAGKDFRKDGYPVYGANGIIGYYNKYEFEKPQIIVGCRGVVGSLFKTLPKSSITHNSLIIKPIAVEKYYLFYLLKQSNLQSVAGGSAQPQITIRDLSQLPVLVAEKDIRNKFENIVINLEKKLLNTIYENQKLASLRDLLLPKLMSGEMRLKI